MDKKSRIAVALLIATAPAGAWAGADGDCGVGSSLWHGQKGIAPQVLAMTTNGTFYQTFAVTSGTSGCNPDAAVKSNWKVAVFIDQNMDKLARDMAIGSGETLDTLAALIGVKDEHRQVFFQVTKNNFGKIFASDSTTTVEITGSLKQILATDSTLSQYTVSI